MSIRISEQVINPYVIDYDHKGFTVKDLSDSKPDRSLGTFHDLGTALGFINTSLILSNYGGGTMSLGDFITTQDSLQKEIYNSLTANTKNDPGTNSSDQESSTIEVKSQEIANIQQA